MMNALRVVVAGHTCLDIIPCFEGGGASALAELLTPGRLTNIGPAVLATGGAVPNVGLALHRLGQGVRLAGKIGDDALGAVVRGILAGHDPALARNLIVSATDQTSYTLVLSPPGVDRIFLHHSGANDTFTAADVSDDLLEGGCLLHLGYPPLMRRLLTDDGEQARLLLARARRRGLMTSLDMSLPDPNSPAGRVDWRRWLAHVLPEVDFFVPSLDETLAMLGRLDATDLPSQGVVEQAAGALLDCGAAVVALKLGAHGCYLRTTAHAPRLHGVRGLDQPQAWGNRQLYAPCFQVEVAGTTGSGDCTVAGLLVGVVSGLPPEQCLRMAVAVGACSVEQPDATGGVQPWEAVRRRLDAGWRQRPCLACYRDWPALDGIHRGPEDAP